MSKPLENQITIWKCAYDQLGIYPEVSVQNGVETKRTEFQNGWNAAILAFTTKRNKITYWLYSLTNEQQAIIHELIFQDHYLILYQDEDKFGLAVNCSDVFAWGCADSEDCSLDDLPALLKASNEKFGLDKWCCHKRNQRPQEQVIRRMKAAGVWDDVMEALPN